jgi:Mal s 1 allergenic protein-like
MKLSTSILLPAFGLALMSRFACAEDTPPLPGKGLAQHDFLYSGEWDTRKPVQTMFLVKGGKVDWTYEIPIKDANGNLSEYSDMHRLSNGDIVFAYKTGWRKITPKGETIYDYQCPKTEEGWTECHSAQPIGQDKVLFMVNGVPAKLFLYNIKTRETEMEHVMQTKEPVNQKSVHGQFRNVRMTKAGTYLIAHMNLGRVIEYDKDWKELWSCEAPSVWHATRLKNGNTLISGNQHGFVREINPAGEIVWEVKKGDLPGITINGVHQATRLANGNTVFCNWTAGVKKPEWPSIVQVVEVTPEKQVVWAFREWTEPDLGPASCIQLLDEPGKMENGDLMR